MTGIEVAMIVMIVASAAMSVHQANEQNQAAKRSMKVASDNASRRREYMRKRKDAAQKGAVRSRDIESIKLRNQAARVAGTVKVAQAEGSLSTGSGSGAAMIGQLNRDKTEKAELLADNTGGMLSKINSDFEAGMVETQGTYEAQFAAAQGQMSSPFLAGLQGGISGAGTALSLGSAAGYKFSGTPGGGAGAPPGGAGGGGGANIYAPGAGGST
jgi:hypothetical protein